MESRAIERLFPGTFRVHVSGVSATLVAAAGGELTGRSIAGTDTGRWSVRSGKLCIMLRDWFDGHTRCSEVVRDGDGFRADKVHFRKL